MKDKLALIGLEWCGSRLSAWAFDDAGEILSSTTIQEPRRPLPAELIARSRFHVDEWLGAWPDVPVIAAGDVGLLTQSVQILTIPVPLVSLAGHVMDVDGIRIVPWIRQTQPPDITCGAETILLGLDEEHASVCIAGRHTRHVLMEHGRVVGLSTEITAELRDILLTSGSLALEAGTGQTFDPSVFRDWVERALDTEDTPSVFAVEAAVLTGQLDAAHKSAAIAGLLIGTDVAAHYDPGDDVLLAADGPLLEAYALALDALGADVEEVSAREAMQDGLFEIADLAGLLGED